ncbi:DUF1329 domain-containing protein [Pseudomonas sp. N040]|uniref:DUF1329 domain-containing protein n=1 Tax=Pseudomonas sp. N040 TaxID=2785325 RepID=UPI0018A33AC2|nr:DUF1329 domain-containing protein [Pseudomonas sp. N040]MBF7729759.1 DUF1329 domain-containing protein [Pseudomonas sp. N040]MBW7013401.1 DUF1329 domain-containing protein [Pseudomonas sp. N040]
MKFVQTLMAASLAVAFAGAAQAAVSLQEAEKLGTTLTGVGAERAANADGSIPEYTGGNTQLPAGFNAGDSYRPNPYANEKPVLVIDQSNLAANKDKLTATTAELLKRYPNNKVEVYPTHRSVWLPQAIVANAKLNAVSAKTVNDGVGIANALPGVPFPIPQTGSEVMWNHLLRYSGVTIQSKFDSWNVDSAGVPTLATTGLATVNLPVYEDLTRVMEAKDIFYRIKVNYSGPARRAGEAILVQDAVNPIVQPRRAWQYLPGQRRVKLAPDLAYDTPNPGTAGAATYDDTFVFTGALDRFEWKLIGKQEMYIPYNTYDLVYGKDVKAIVKANNIAPDQVRWEKHRVWVVEGSLKPGKRHIYHKRRVYIDEDSWTAVAADMYDARGDLYRGSYAFMAPSYDVGVPNATAHAIYDLVGGSYTLNGLTGPYGGVRYIDNLSKSKWSPESLAGAGIR